MRAAGYEPINACQRSPPGTLDRGTEGSLKAHQWKVGATSSGIRDGMSQRILDTACINV